MIDFRYHLVSIVAVFLALGLGLLLGSTELEPYLARGLEKTSSTEHRQIDSLLGTQRQLDLELSRNQQFAQAAERQLLEGLLAGQRVVIVAAPGAPGGVTSAVSQLLTTYAGATVTGQVQLQQNLFDTSAGTQQELASLAAELAPPGTVLRQGSPIAQAGQVLGETILTRDAPGLAGVGQRQSVSGAVINGFAARGFITLSKPLAARATLAVVVIPGTPPGQSDSTPASQALVTLAQALDQAGRGTVVAGTTGGSGVGSAIDVMRNGGRSAKLTSVDDADTPIGQIVVVQALAQQLNGMSGSYGTAPDASAAAPSPAPTPPAAGASPTAGTAQASPSSSATPGKP